MRCYRLLVVDDDTVDRRLIAHLLTQAGPANSQIHQAENGAAGLKALCGGGFDCVLLDFSLPDMTGLEFLAAAAAEAGQQPCAVVLVTGQGNEAVAVEAMKRGVQDYLVKDQLSASILWRTVTHAVSRAELQQRLADSRRELTASNLALEQEVATRKVAQAEMLRAKDTAELANQAKTRFVAMVTHELRTPLNGILGHIQLVRIEKGLSPRQSTHLEAVRQAGQHLLGMIERVLDCASVENAKLPLYPVEVSLHDLADTCITFLSPIAAERGLNLLLLRAHDAPRHIVADPARLRQVLLNLIGNALKNTESGSVELRLLAGASPGELRVEVADTGRGIDKSSRDLLFRDFDRLESAISMEGTDLGLAIAANIVGMMGGKIGYAPNPTGGSVFWFELPATNAAVPPIAPLAESAPVPASRSTAAHRPVLLVDDIKINRDIIGAFLETGGYAVTLAKDGEEAVRLAAEKAFDLILMDVRMPGMDGLEATRRIRAFPDARGRVPILGQTAYTFPDQVALCRDAGMDGHITKPIDYETLIRAVDNAVARVVPADVTADQGLAVVAERPPLRFDRAVLDGVLALLPPDDIAASLKSLQDHEEEMLRVLDPTADLALRTDAAHSLASAAGMLGFVALSTVSRNFENAVTHDAPEAVELGQQLRVELDAALVELAVLQHEISPQPA
jgi:signal transduction histidine kinase/HPt (histidine-containing phosphotransfer) domain-containing protein